jgi:DNA-binding IclR family transcriptional regulator
VIQVIERFHKILEYVSTNSGRACQLGELAQMLGVSPPACANIVRSMVALGYLNSLGSRRGYVLGAAVFGLSLSTPYRYLINVARPVMEDLSRGHNTLTVLVVESGGKRMELLRMDKESTITVSPYAEGHFFNLFKVNTGLLLLSFMEKKRIRYFWNRDNGPENILKIDNFDAFYNWTLQTAQAKELILPGTMSAPVYSGGSVIAALGITYRDGEPEKTFAEFRTAIQLLNSLL